MASLKVQFTHENSWADELLNKIPKMLAVYNQPDRASTSIPLNIAERNGKYTDADRCRFFDIARGSALESGACLDVLVAKKRVNQPDSGKEILARIVSMLVGLIRHTSSHRVYEQSVDHGTPPQDQGLRLHYRKYHPTPATPCAARSDRILSPRELLSAVELLSTCLHS